MDTNEYAQRGMPPKFPSAAILSMLCIVVGAQGIMQSEQRGVIAICTVVFISGGFGLLFLANPVKLLAGATFSIADLLAITAAIAVNVGAFTAHPLLIVFTIPLTLLALGALGYPSARLWITVILLLIAFFILPFIGMLLAVV